MYNTMWGALPLPPAPPAVAPQPELEAALARALSALQNSGEPAAQKASETIAHLLQR